MSLRLSFFFIFHFCSYFTSTQQRATTVNRWKLSFCEALGLHADFLHRSSIYTSMNAYMQTPQCAIGTYNFFFGRNHIHFLNDFKIGFFSTHHHEYGHNEYLYLRHIDLTHFATFSTLTTTNNRNKKSHFIILILDLNIFHFGFI